MKDKEFNVSRWFYSDLVNKFYDGEVQGLSVEGDKLVIRTSFQDVEVDEHVMRSDSKFLYEGLKRAGNTMTEYSKSMALSLSTYLSRSLRYLTIEFMMG